MQGPQKSILFCREDESNEFCRERKGKAAPKRVPDKGGECIIDRLTFSVELELTISRLCQCPICLEPFETASKELDKDEPLTKQKQKQKLKRVDSFGIPLIGTDEKPIKMLRCGHIFDTSCWKIWVDSGHGNPWVCPVCRQDVGRVKRRTTSPSRRGQRANAEETRRDEGTHQHALEERRTPVARIPPVTPSMLLLPVGHTHPSYSSIQTLASFGGTPFAPFSHPPLRRLYPRHASATNVHIHDNPTMPTEQTPLFGAAADEESDDY